MGLDMYLSRKLYVWGDDRMNLKITGLRQRVNPGKVSYIIEEAGYWRKANAIHNWFVTNVQEDKDDCGTYWVPREKLEDLYDAVVKVLASTELVDGEVIRGTTWTKKDGLQNNMEQGKVLKDTSIAEKLLPTASGFFFGGTDYDDYYWDCLLDTKKILEEVLKDTEGDYEYTSSW